MMDMLRPRASFSKMSAGSLLLCIVAFAWLPATAVAKEPKVSIDSYRIAATSPEYIDVKLDISNDGFDSGLWFGVTAKSADGTVASGGFEPVSSMQQGQFSITLRAQRPRGVAPQTDHLMVIVYTISGKTILTRKIAFHYSWPAKDGSASEPPGPARITPYLAFYLNYYDEDFEALDLLIKEWNNPSVRDENGEWKLDGFRSLFLNYSTKDRDWKGDLKRIKKWRAFNPKSAGAAIAEAKYWIASAWHIRGNAYDVQDDAVALRVFGERMQQAEQVLKESKKFAAGNPLWYETYLDVAASSRRDGEFIKSLFDEATGKFPYFQPLYFEMAKYYAPPFGDSGDWKGVDEVANEAVRNTSDQDGSGNYARLYTQVADTQSSGFDLFRNSRASWLAMKDSFKDMVKRYPSPANFSEFAAFACQADDRAAYLDVRPHLVNQAVPGKWPGNYSMDLCDRRFMLDT